ncbi:WG repeat-containing protein [Psychrobacter sp. AH5]|uniref:WG repeat-containing protein n=1 Tax=Psychrobacter sp. AH5 TaxID=2937433 RepID=UPI00333E72E4
MNKWVLLITLICTAQAVQANDDCVKPTTQQKFDYVECINKKGIARVGNIVQTALGDFPYPLGLVDASGKIILPVDYHSIDFPSQWNYDSYLDDLPDGLILVVKRDLQNNAMFGNLGMQDKYGLVNSQGELIVPLGIYDNIKMPYSNADNTLFTVVKNKKYGFIDTKGRVVIPLMYDYAQSFEEGLVSVSKEDKFGIIDRQNQTIIPFEYEYIDLLNNLDREDTNQSLLFRAKLKDDYALIDQNNQTITDFEYDTISAIYYTNLFIVGKRDKVGVIDNTGKLIVPINYRFIEDTLQSTDPYDFELPQAYIQATLEDKTYLFDKTGKLMMIK